MIDSPGKSDPAIGRLMRLREDIRQEMARKWRGSAAERCWPNQCPGRRRFRENSVLL